jgi:alpha-beta hydrolase superfamily lysophospholipase
MSELTPFTHVVDGERLSGLHGGADEPAKATVVLLHGAGNGGKERLLPLLEEFAAHGCRVLAFDFSGRAPACCAS